MKAQAIAGSAGLLAALAGAISIATDSPQVSAYAGNSSNSAPFASSTIQAGNAGNVDVIAEANDVSSSSSIGIAVGGLVGISVNAAANTVAGLVGAAERERHAWRGLAGQGPGHGLLRGRQQGRCGGVGQRRCQHRQGHLLDGCGCSHRR